MENKINIAELLRDCPQGMELDCTMFEGLEFDGIADNEYLPIRCRIKNPEGGYTFYNFTKYGCWIDTYFVKCVIFPKGKTSWEGFQRSFKDGDIIFVTNNESNEDFHYKYIAIFKEIKRDKDIYVYGLYSYNEDVFSLHPYLCEITNSTIIKLATEEEKAKLFKAIKDNGYKWNAETKTLEKLPKFKVGDRIKKEEKIATIVRIYENCYDVRYDSGIGSFTIDLQDEWELVPNKFDISTLKPFDKVLTRVTTGDVWGTDFFGYYKDGLFHCNGHTAFRYCIPFKNNEHLLSTTGDCDDFYKTWEK